MKKTVLTLACVFATFLSSFAMDMTDVWTQFQAVPNFIVSNVSPEKAEANGFETLAVAINTAPTSNDIVAAQRLSATIDSKQKITSVNQQGVEVTVYAAPASADASHYKLMLVVDKNDNEDKALIVLYGICTNEGMLKALQNLSLESIIGG